jgi:hypothetical protein
MPDNLITRRRKKAAQEMRPTSRDNGDGTRSTHVMENGTGEGRFKYQVNPTIFPNKDGSWTDLTPKTKEEVLRSSIDKTKKGGETKVTSTEKPIDRNAAYREAAKRGEVFGFKNKVRAEKFAYGSWKQGSDRREAMKNYRADKKAAKKGTR